MALLIPRFANEEIDPRRRALLLLALQGGLLGAGASLLPTTTAEAALFGSVPRRLSPKQSIFEIEGEVSVNRKRADISTRILPGDTVETGENSRIIFVDRDNAHILRQNSRIQLPDESGVASVLRVLTGALLSVFGTRKRRIVTSTATIGIRGTGVYVEVDPDEAYICTCFGTADLIPIDALIAEETVVSEHHDAPRFATRSSGGGKRIRKAPFRNHTDVEVALIEELVGRVPPFAFTLDRFDSPIKSY